MSTPIGEKGQRYRRRCRIVKTIVCKVEVPYYDCSMKLEILLGDFVHAKERYASKTASEISKNLEPILEKVDS